MRYFITTLLIIALAVSCYAQDSSGISRVYSNSIPARDVAIQGNYAYVAAYTNAAAGGFSIFDITNPLAPTQAGSCSTITFATAVAVSGNYAYVGATNGLYIINVANPASPTQAGLYFNGINTIYAIKVVGNYAYVATESAGGILRIIDISNSSSPTQVGYWYCSARLTDIAISGNYAYVSLDSGIAMKAINISNHANPVEAGTYSAGWNGIARGIAVSGHYAYMAANRNGGLRVVNVENLSTLTQVAIATVPSYACGVTIVGNHAYVAGDVNGLYIFDITNPVAPVRTNFYSGSGAAVRVAVSGNYVYVAEMTMFRVYDCSSTDVVSERPVVQPSSYRITAYPNPFNPTTTISFSVPKTSNVNLTIFDANGRQLKSLAQGRFLAGEHHILFNGNDLPSGVYFATINANGVTKTQRLVLVK